MPKEPTSSTSSSRRSKTGSSASRKTKKTYWDDEHRDAIHRGVHPEGRRFYGAAITLVPGSALGMPTQVFGKVEPRRLPGIDATCDQIIEDAERKVATDTVMTEAEKAEYLRIELAFAEGSRNNQTWMSHPEPEDPSIRYSEINFDQTPWLTFRWWSGSRDGLYFFDIIDRERGTVLKHPKDLQMMMIWGSEIVVLNTMETEWMNATTHSWFEKGQWHYRTDRVPSDAEERYGVPVGGVVVVLRDYKVIGHIQVPLV
ncbi:hypothetical protein PENSPDRAFT_666031 [Peniophora sp. CONT]|nr:hypothetical protein PENSPDRAFT_666031 [Peniophora sp. CONT]